MSAKYFYKRTNPATGECIEFLATTRQRNDARYELCVAGEEFTFVRRLAYNYAEIDLDTGECIGVISSTRVKNGEQYIPIPSYNEDYMEKYYLNGNWYEDAAGTIPWTPEE